MRTLGRVEQKVKIPDQNDHFNPFLKSESGPADGKQEFISDF
jgi:hypothetical protein